MKSTFVELAMHLAIVLPLILLTLTNRKGETLKIVAVFALYFLMHGLLLYLPTEFESLRLTNGNWNWSGKVYALLGSLLFLALYRKFDLKDYFLTLKQHKDFLKHGLIAIFVIFVLKGLFNVLYLSPTEWDMESLLFQATMPGLDEEIAFRGIMLGLLTKILKPARRPLFHPAIYVTALLFGMAHGLYLNDSFELSYNISSLLITALLGVAWAWMTLKSGSILMALVSHNLGNVTSQVISMGK